MRRLRLAPLWVLLSNPRRLHALFIRLVGWVVVSILARRELWATLGRKLPAYECGNPTGWARTVRVPNIGRLIVPLDSSPVLIEQFLLEIYDWLFRPGPTWVIIDVGAHAGVFTVKSARSANRGRVVALEPHAGNFRYLQENLRLNGIANVTALKLAAYSEPGRLHLYLNPEHSDCHSITERQANHDRFKKVPIIATTLDELKQKLGLDHIDLIKIDVEGAEIQVLQGATNTLDVCSRVCVAAYHAEDQAIAIAGYLTERGFSTFTLDNYVYASKKDQ